MRLLLSKNVAGTTGPCAQPQYILASETCDRAVQNGGARGSLADFSGNLWAESRIDWLAHQSQCMLDAILRNKAQVRRLLKLYCHTLP
ncbi:MAG: hypothetical protein WCB11_22890, partial [Terriglobales bacterium]